MITLRPGEERGRTAASWLDSRHSFSFNRYYDPRFMGFRHLRVINEDWVAPSSGFGTHSHRDMEIITYILSGALEHKDSMGNTSLIRPGEVQRMSAGTGVSHSEYNPSPDEVVHLLQIWLLPAEEGLEPSYEQRQFPVEERQGQLRLVASRDGREGSVTVYQDVNLYAAALTPGEQLEYEFKPGRHAWFQATRGLLTINDTPLAAGDGAAVSEEAKLLIRASEPAEFLLFDLA